MAQKSWEASAGSTRFAQGVEVKLLHFFSGPRGPSQEFQTGFDARVFAKALDRDAAAQFLPAVLLGQVGQDHFEGDAVQWVVGLFAGHHAGRDC